MQSKASLALTFQYKKFPSPVSIDTVVTQINFISSRPRSTFARINSHFIIADKFVHSCHFVSPKCNQVEAAQVQRELYSLLQSATKPHFLAWCQFPFYSAGPRVWIRRVAHWGWLSGAAAIKKIRSATSPLWRRKGAIYFRSLCWSNNFQVWGLTGKNQLLGDLFLWKNVWNHSRIN